MYALIIQKWYNDNPGVINVYYNTSKDKLKEFMEEKLIPGYKDLFKTIGPAKNAYLDINDDIGTASMVYNIEYDNKEHSYFNIVFTITEAHDISMPDISMPIY